MPFCSTLLALPTILHLGATWNLFRLGERINLRWDAASVLMAQMCTLNIYTHVYSSSIRGMELDKLYISSAKQLVLASYCLYVHTGRSITLSHTSLFLCFAPQLYRLHIYLFFWIYTHICAAAFLFFPLIFLYSMPCVLFYFTFFFTV